MGVVSSRMGVVSSRMGVPLSRRATKWFDECENDVICYGLYHHQISNQFYTYSRGWTNVLDSALHHHNQNTKGGNILEE